MEIEPEEALGRYFYNFDWWQQNQILRMFLHLLNKRVNVEDKRFV
jgi:hypothetical protein